VKKASAEATELEDASVDFIAAGRAFHWFDLERAKVEFQRILRPQGWVVLVSNGRVRDDSPMSVAYEALLRDYGTDYDENRKRYEVAPKIDAFFAGAELFREEIYGEQQLTLEAFIGQTQSLSVTPAPGHEKYEEMQSALRKFFSEWQQGGVVSIKTVCRVACGQFGITG
jgi:ubiquinone/menaquinone biosynthesis C-methylase UbiE